MCITEDRIENVNNVEEDSYYTNRVDIEGEIVEEPAFHHETHDEKIYYFKIRTPRLNREVWDTLKVEISSRAADISIYHKGDFVHIQGQFRSYNQKKEGSDKSKLQLYIFVRDIMKEKELGSKNTVRLIGKIKKDPVFRVTPSGREISDIILGVNRIYRRSDYIPCIAWSRNARFVSTLPVDTTVELSGRIQSRVYKKILDDGSSVENTVYEVSVSDINVKDE